MINQISITRKARKDLKKVPIHIVRKLMTWVNDVETIGLEEVRKLPGFHDEPLMGKRRGQRSIRLSRSYRAIYVIKKSGRIEFVSIEEITKHAY